MTTHRPPGGVARQFPHCGHHRHSIALRCHRRQPTSHPTLGARVCQAPLSALPYRDHPELRQDGHEADGDLTHRSAGVDVEVGPRSGCSGAHHAGPRSRVNSMVICSVPTSRSSARIISVCPSRRWRKSAPQLRQILNPPLIRPPHCSRFPHLRRRLGAALAHGRPCGAILAVAAALVYFPPLATSSDSAARAAASSTMYRCRGRSWLSGRRDWRSACPGSSPAGLHGATQAHTPAPARATPSELPQSTFAMSWCQIPASRYRSPVTTS